jgi:ABC-type methionine transport system permease subunit
MRRKVILNLSYSKGIRRIKVTPICTESNAFVKQQNKQTIYYKMCVFKRSREFLVLIVLWVPCTQYITVKVARGGADS